MEQADGSFWTVSLITGVTDLSQTNETIVPLAFMPRNTPMPSKRCVAENTRSLKVRRVVVHDDGFLSGSALIDCSTGDIHWASDMKLIECKIDSIR